MTDAPSRRVLLCCETGQGRGHVTTLATAARGLGPGWTVQAILPELAHADILRPLCARVDRGASLARLPGRPPAGTFNWATWLHNRGYGDPDVLHPHFTWWSEALRRIRPRLVVSDYAPTALLAARAQGIATVVTGAAFGCPPAGLSRFPDMLTPGQASLHDDITPAAPPCEDSMCDCINDTLGPLGLPPLGRLPEVYAADASLPRGVSLWDPYTGQREGPLLAPLDPVPPLQRRPGDEVFVYFSTEELAEPAIRDALCRMPFDACLVAPGLTAELGRALAANPKLRIAAAPLPGHEIAQRSRVILCAGQAGMLSLAVLAGIPAVALPLHHEQLSNALRASENLGGVRTVPKGTRSAEAILTALAELWDRPAVGSAARLAAMELRAAYAEPARDAYRRRLHPLLARSAADGR
jgi:hypothetical protein